MIYWQAILGGTEIIARILDISSAGLSLSKIEY